MKMKPYKAGQIFRTKKKIPVTGIIIFGAPFSGMFEGILPKEENLFLDYTPKKTAKGLWLKPERYDDFEKEFIEEKTRRNPEYDSYAISASIDEISSLYEILS